ncbi:c-type cytochrome [Cytophagaceae bacterium DM2B3-1]|uniref:C-type cytochrome n=1 Tax=Xanthocytophaga flava TaxID=3048013 RepID=A0ABT7CKT2_9BACT|nr:c-type cytochrome [Xanthocytophaga flavus]MDJ1469838.1 c-type cytochrome [Xanthocytophaga flavus]MDJ1494351.1 c-type cytochrome [Xanthocytophaga flavus]
MKKVLRIFAIIVIVLGVCITGLLTYVKVGLPNVGAAPEIKIKPTPELAARGEYLANHVNVCMDCHSTRDWTRFSGPVVPGTMGKGGERFGEELGLPGVYYARNITPAGLGEWTDGEIFRAISAGVSREGKPLFPLMPHPYYGKMDSTDIVALVAYLRTIKPIKNQVPESEPSFPMNFIIHTIPQKPTFQKRPDTSDVVAYGAYLVNAGTCEHCHSQKTKEGKLIPGMEFAGGVEFGLPTGVLRSANLTPDNETGLGLWSREAFIQRFKAHDPATGYQAQTVKSAEQQTIMPWTMYSGMSEHDLGAIYSYLKTLKPVKNPTVRFSPAKSEIAQK